MKTKSSDSGAFRPAPLLAPTLNSTPADYAVYIGCYKAYVDALAVFKKRFWTSTSKHGGKLETSFEDALVDVAIDNKGKVLATKLRVGADTDTFSVSNGFVATRSALIPDVKIVSAPPPENKGAQFKAVDPKKKAAKRRRWRANKAARILQSSIKKANALVTLERANVELAQSAGKKGETGWTTVTRKGKEVQHRRPDKKKAKKPGKGGKGGDGGPKGPPPGPPGAPSGGDKKKGKGPAPSNSKDDKPNRKERRRATYGPPQPEKVQEVAPTPVEQVVKPAPFSFDGDSSSEDEKPKKAPVIWPPPSASWQATSTDLEVQGVHRLRMDANRAAVKSELQGVYVDSDESATKLLVASEVDRSVGIGPTPVALQRQRVKAAKRGRK